MTHIPAEVAETRIIETIRPDNLPGAKDPTVVAIALEKLLEQSAQLDDVRNGILAPMYQLWSIPLVHKLIPGLEDLANEYHIGNFFLERATGKRVFESMPIYPRLGMHLMFYGGTQLKLLHNPTVEGFLKDLSIWQGKVYDAPESVKSIPSFIKTYSISLDELEQPDFTKYKCFNDFFHRKLKPNARPVQNASDSTRICCAADSRLTVYPTVSAAKTFWIKGNNFAIHSLLGVQAGSEKARVFDGGSVAIFRLAPQDYHRFHSPVDGIVGGITDIPGQYYTVNPQAVNESGFDVFTENRRAVLYLTHSQSCAPVAVVAIGAMLVGSVMWTNGGQKGASVKRGDELGYFAYGGSTVVVLFPKGLIQFDNDLLRNSNLPIETLVRVGDSLGRSLLSGAGFGTANVLRDGDQNLAEGSRESSSIDMWKRVAQKCTIL